MLVVNKYGADSIRLYLMNSPLVRAEPLKFQEDGVLSILKDVFIPWFNVYRFLLQNVNRWETENNKKWVFDEAMFQDLGNFTNVMDRWIIVSNQNLIKFVRKELEGYRLYTVVAKKVKFLELLSNWYVKLNRSRIKGDISAEDSNTALNVLFFVLLNSMLTMSPYVPFIVETFYQNMRKCINEKSQYMEKSIHFLQVPNANDKLIDESLEETVDRMQRVIESCRAMRDQKKVPVKQPVTELLMVCVDEAAIGKMKVVEKYILEEVNVASIKYTADWKTYMSFDFNLNHKVLGEKFGNDYKDLLSAIKLLKEEDRIRFMEEKTLTIDFKGNKLTLDENLMTPKATFKQIKEKNKSIGGNLDFAAVLDLTVSEALKSKGLAREFINRIQRLRKSTKLNPTDAIVITYEFAEENKAQNVKNAVVEHNDHIKNTLRKPFWEHDSRYVFSYAQEAFEVDGEKFTIRIAYNVVVPMIDNLLALVNNDQKELHNLLQTLSCYSACCPSVRDSKQLEFNLNGKKLIVLKDQHYKVLV